MEDPIVILDVETTGLEPTERKLLEVALVVATKDLEFVDATTLCIGPVAHTYTKKVWDKPAYDLHRRNGLIKACNSEDAWPLADAEAELIAALQHWEVPEGTTALVGNSVAFDRAWVKQHMPKLHGKFSHRNIDVSGEIELLKRWYGTLLVKDILSEELPDMHGVKFVPHRALPDAMVCLNQLRVIKSRFHVKRAPKAKAAVA